MQLYKLLRSPEEKNANAKFQICQRETEMRLLLYFIYMYLMFSLVFKANSFIWDL